MSIYLDRKLYLGAVSGGSDTEDTNIKYVNSASDLSTIDSTVQYVVTRSVDMGSTSIEVPETGLTLVGLGTGISSLYSSEDDFQLFTSPSGGSGYLSTGGLRFTVDGENSQVYDLTSATGDEAFISSGVAYVNCTSRGEINGYAQGVESTVAFIGGTPTLTLSGTWSSGWSLTVSSVRGLDSGMTDPLFKEGTSFLMNSRFYVETNCDLPTSASFCDFTSSNFTSPSLVDVRGCVFTRDGEFVSGDGGYFPNLDPEDLVCSWKDNNGLRNTVEGGYLEITNESTTSISSSDTFVDIEGTWTVSGLSHFTNDSNGVLTHKGNNPTQYNMTCSLSLDSNSNNVLEVKAIKWSETDQEWQDQFTYEVTVDSLSGQRDVGRINFSRRVLLYKDDMIKLQVANTSGSSNITAEMSSSILIERA